MRKLRPGLSLVAAALMLQTTPLSAANHREAPITALDHKADITDVYAFVSYSANQQPNTAPRKVTLIMCVDPLLEPANGPNHFPFDDDILYEIKIDNNNDAVADLKFQFRFKSEQRLPGVFQTLVGVGNGVAAPSNSPAPVAPGTPLLPGRITSFSSAGLGQRQTYTVTMVKGTTSTPLTGGPFYAVPNNIGPRTMDYAALYQAGTYALDSGISLFAGTTDDAFWIDLGGAFDTLNLRSTGGFVVPAVLAESQNNSRVNFAADTVSGYAVNSIAIEVPIEMLTSTGQREAAASTAATIGVWATTSRPRTTVRKAPDPVTSEGDWQQVQRMANPLINELIIGTGSKDRFSMDEPKNDSQFAAAFLDPLLARAINAATAGVVSIPTPPRTDLLPLVTYAPPIAARGTTAGPVADLLRLNVGIPATHPNVANRMGLLGGDAAGFPNGRRLFDDVTDIALRAVAGVLNSEFNIFPNNRLGDGVNINDTDYRMSFPFLGYAPSGRDRRHVDPGEPGCNGVCPVQ